MARVSAQENIKIAAEIATSELRACYTSDGIIAGSTTYDDYWTGDFFWAALGALSLGDVAPVISHVKLLARFQRKSGQIPFLIRRNFPVLPFCGIKVGIPYISQVRSHKFFFLSSFSDSTPYFIILLSELWEKGILEKADYLENFRHAVNWCIQRIGKDNLVFDLPISGWNDGVYKLGKVLYTNVLFYKALVEAGSISSEARDISQRVLKSIREKLWGNGYYNDWVFLKSHTNFCTVGNMLAVVYDVATKAEVVSILDFVEKNLYKDPFVSTVFPAYKQHKIDIWNRLSGMGDYANGSSVYWLEPVLLYVIALAQIGLKSKAVNIFKKVASQIVRSIGVYEIYDSKGKPFSSRLYKSEHPFARSCGLFLLAKESLKDFHHQ
ncbi:hypothetical protein JW962_03820 [Candidatus Dojkabacteria bacterium]|nr:hypothetical protein [Candidatus Dojkabacteria bacterium]